MEAIGAASSILALTIFAYDTSKSLYEAVSSFKSQRRTIQDVQTDLGSLVALLGLIREQAEGSENDTKFEPLRKPVECCTTTCQEMREMLTACTKHAKDGRDSIRDWLKMQYRGKSFEDVKQRLASYKSTLLIAFASINIQEHAATQGSLNELQKSIEGTKEDLEDQLDQVQHAISGAEESLRGLLQADLAQLQRSLDSLAQAQRVTETAQPQIVIERNRAGQESRALFGSDSSRPQFHLSVSDNEAQQGAVMAAGVHSSETLQALLKGSGTADLVHVLQALQNQSQSTSGTTLQSILNGLSTVGTQGFTDGPSTVNAANAELLRLEETPKRVEIQGPSTRAVHKDGGNYGQALR